MFKHIVGARRMKIANISQRCLRLISEIYIFIYIAQSFVKDVLPSKQNHGLKPYSFTIKTCWDFQRDKQEHGQSWFSLFPAL